MQEFGSKVIVISGNEKNSGKTLMAASLCNLLLKFDLYICLIDLNPLSEMPLSSFFADSNNGKLSIKTPFYEEFGQIINEAKKLNHYIIIDCPDNTYDLFHKAAAANADILISLIQENSDLELIIKGNEFGTYSKFIWEAKMEKAKNLQSPINWMILPCMAKQVSTIKELAFYTKLEKIAKKLSGKILPKFTKRNCLENLASHRQTIFSEGINLNIPIIAAKQEFMIIFEEILGI